MWKVVVTFCTPRHLWLRHACQTTKTRCRGSRIPALQARSIMWALPPAILLGEPEAVHECLGVLASLLRRLLPARAARNTSFNEKWWPESMRKIESPPGFCHPLTDIIWPDSLTRLVFGYYFDEPIQRVHWLASLQLFTFWHNFNWPLDGVKWPDSLQHLTFGSKFDKPIRGIVWPDSIQRSMIGL